MNRFFAELQEERARSGMLLEDIASVTKVPQRHLLALEEGRFTELPGGIFRRGILRSYLQAIGVEAAPWMVRFEVCLAELDAAVEPPVELEQIAAGVERSRAVDALQAKETGWSGVMFTLVLLLAFGWCVWRFALHGHVVLSAVTTASRQSTSRAVTRVGGSSRPLHFASAAAPARGR